nr:hypothetical protein [uncultured Psychroserpens sp.]
MKKTFYFGVLIMLSLSLMSFNCSDDDDGSPNSNSQQISEIESDVQSGTWRITNFNDSGQNETSDFNGYDFSFNADGSLLASNGSNTMTGTWSVTDDSNSSSDDSNDDDDIDFNIFFPVSESNDFEDLNDDWDVVMTSSTRIELIDVSGGNGGTDILTFEKN